MRLLISPDMSESTMRLKGVHVAFARTSEETEKRFEVAEAAMQADGPGSFSAAFMAHLWCEAVGNA